MQRFKGSLTFEYDCGFTQIGTGFYAVSLDDMLSIALYDKRSHELSSEEGETLYKVIWEVEASDGKVVIQTIKE